MPATTTLPPYLRTAQERAAAAAERISPTPTTPAPTPTTHTPPNLASLAARKTNRTIKPPPGSHPTPTTKPGNHSTPFDPEQAVLEGLADRIVAESADPEAAALARPHLPAILDALLEGAKKAGSVGAADRAMVFRLLRHSSSTAREQAQAAKQLGAALGDRLASAMARSDMARARVLDVEKDA